MRATASIVGLIIASGAIAPPAQGAPAEYVYFGTIDTVDDPTGLLDPAIQIGSVFTLTFRVDFAQVSSSFPAGDLWVYTGSGALSGDVLVEGVSHPLVPDIIGIAADIIGREGVTVDLWGSAGLTGSGLEGAFLFSDPGLTMIDDPSFFTIPDFQQFLGGLRIRLGTVAATLAEGGIDLLDRDADGLDDDADLCPDHPSQPNTDTDGNGIGDECECGDSNLDGTVNVADILAINAWIFTGGDPPPLCDGNLDRSCNVADILAASLKIFGADTFCQQYPVLSTPLCLDDCNETHEEGRAGCEATLDPAICGGDPACEASVLAARDLCLESVDENLATCSDAC